jgi:hypothetical protein
MSYGRIMSNEMRIRGHLATNPHCQHCQNELETILLLLRDCPLAGVPFFKARDRTRFFVVDLGPWLISNLSARHLTEEGNPWSVVFGAEVWLIFRTGLFLYFKSILKNIFFYYFKLFFYVFRSF